MWVVVATTDYQLHYDASDYLAALRRQEDASVNTERVYAGRIALYLSHCAIAGVDWAAPTMRQLAAFLHWLIDDPLPPKGRRASVQPRYRDKRTANQIVTTVCQFLRYSALTGRVSAEVVALLSEPKALHFLPAGLPRGEGREPITMNVKTIKFKVAIPGFEYLTDEEIQKVLSFARHARDRFLFTLMSVTGIRIGEALGLRREDMHLLPNSRLLGCSVPGPHIHIRRRQNSNGALAKSRYPRWIPVGEDIGDVYADYQWERDEVPEAADSDMVFVNLFASPLGEPMKYSNTYELFKRLAKMAGFLAHPHMLRHSALTRWVRKGVRRDVIQKLAGHKSPHSQDPYHHASDQEMREAVTLVAKIHGRDDQ